MQKVLKINRESRFKKSNLDNIEINICFSSKKLIKINTN